MSDILKGGRGRSRLLDMLLEDSDSDDETELLAIAAALSSQSHPRPHGGSTRGHRFIFRDRHTTHDILFRDYFSQSPLHSAAQFRSRFRMSRPLFLRITAALSSLDPYFIQKRNASGVSGLSPIQKTTAALRILTHGVSTDSLDASMGIGDSTVIESLKRFASGVVSLFGPHYLRSLTHTDVRRLLTEGENRGFPGMLGSIDCMHWKWRNCPVKWRQKYGVADYEPTVVFEGLASYDLWIWHAYFGIPWGCNDVTVPERSSFIGQLAAPAEYTINGREYTTGYYLASDVYPPWSTVVKTVLEVGDGKERRYVECHESARKDVERALQVLLSQFAFLRGPTRFWQRDTLRDLVSACIIMHNMIVEDERDDMNSDFDYDEVDGNRGVTISRERTPEFVEFIERYQSLDTTEAQSQLQNDLIEHFWHSGQRGEIPGTKRVMRSLVGSAELVSRQENN